MQTLGLGDQVLSYASAIWPWVDSQTRLVHVCRGEREYMSKPQTELPAGAVQVSITPEKYEFLDGIVLHLGASQEFNTVLWVEP